MYLYECTNCCDQITLDYKCKKIMDNPPCLKCEDGFYDLAPPDEREFDPDNILSESEVWQSRSKRFFHCGMRFDKTARTKTAYDWDWVWSFNPWLTPFSKCRTAFFKHTGTGWLNLGLDKGGRKSTNYVMGKVSAQAKSGRGTRYIKKDSEWLQSEEWLHLCGDNLGGATSATNLVAGSVAANTLMLAIESVVSAVRTNVQIRVSAYCSAKHVADVIQYEVRSRTSNGYFKCYINCLNRYCTKVTFESLQRYLRMQMGIRN